MLFELYEKGMYFLKTLWNNDTSYIFLDILNLLENESWFIPALMVWIVLFWFTYLGRFIFRFIALFAIFGGVGFMFFS
ncbi:MAG: hypothetical protein ACRCV3_04430 [Desulfovibrionaceae bacterium]